VITDIGRLPTFSLPLAYPLVRQIKGGGQAELPFAKHPPHTISYTFDFQTLCPPHRRPHVDGPVTSPYTCDSTNVPAVCSHGKLRACQTALANCPPRPLTHPQAVCCRRAVCSHGKLPHGLSACPKGGSRRLTCGGTGASSHGHAKTRENSTLPGTCTRRSSHA